MASTDNSNRTCSTVDDGANFEISAKMNNNKKHQSVNKSKKSKNTNYNNNSNDDEYYSSSLSPSSTTNTPSSSEPSSTSPGNSSYTHQLVKPSMVVPVNEANNPKRQQPIALNQNSSTDPSANIINMSSDENQATLDMPLLQADNITSNVNVLNNQQQQQTNGTNGGINGNHQQAPFMYKQQQMVDSARKAFATNRTKDIKFRKKQLRQLQLMFNENMDAINDALSADLNKPPFESKLGELNLLDNELRDYIGNLDKYTKPKHKAKTSSTFFDSLYVHQEPLGVCLVIGSWNYPLLLSMSPFIGALAAGNCAILKVSEHAPFVGSLLESLIPRYIDNECYHILNCDLNQTSYLLKTHKFDHIFYTGGENGGRAIYEEASKKLTPVVLELGGKSPVYIDDNVIDKDATWSRLFWGKFLNAGQTCIAPDYVLCSEKAQDAARKQFVKMIDRFYNGDPINGKHYAKIINLQHFERLKRLVKESRLVLGGQLYPEKLQIEPTIIMDVSLDDPVMKEEIFGPLLPFVTVNSPEQAIQLINDRPKPLALYLFTNSDKLVNKFLKETSSGSMVVNDVVVQISSAALPFGGVGNSGFGKYHGKYSLETFSNSRAIVKRGYNPILEIVGSFRYPPYDDKKLWLLTQLGMVRNIWYPGRVLQGAIMFVSGAASVMAYNFISTLYGL